MSDLIQRLHKIAEDYVKGYELRDDAACHTPNELEHTMLMDCTIGVVDEIVQVVAAEIERLERERDTWRDEALHNRTFREQVTVAADQRNEAERQRDEAWSLHEDERTWRRNAEAERDEAIAALRSGAWLIWSNEHRAWWGPDRCGYRKAPDDAGRYNFDDAMSICRVRSWENGVPPETMVHESAVWFGAKRPA